MLLGPSHTMNGTIPENRRCAPLLFLFYLAGQSIFISMPFILNTEKRKKILCNSTTVFSKFSAIVSFNRHSKDLLLMFIALMKMVKEIISFYQIRTMRIKVFFKYVFAYITINPYTC